MHESIRLSVHAGQFCLRDKPAGFKIGEFRQSRIRYRPGMDQPPGLPFDSFCQHITSLAQRPRSGEDESWHFILWLCCRREHCQIYSVGIAEKFHFRETTLQETAFHMV